MNNRKNILREKSYDFALAIVGMYKNIFETKKQNTYLANKSCGVA
jgi:hypothetical protein